MSKDISTKYTEYQNKQCGRRFYGFWKDEKTTVIPPKEYGAFCLKRMKYKTSR